MTFTTKRSLIALLLSLVLVVSIFTVSVFAEGEEAGAETTAEVTTEAATEAATETETETATESTTEKVDEKVIETRNTLIINGVIIGCIIAVAVALIIRFHKKLFEFLRTVKSELKKIVWTSKENTRKSFIVVAIVAVAVALALFLIDYSCDFVVGTLAGVFAK